MNPELCCVLVLYDFRVIGAELSITSCSIVLALAQPRTFVQHRTRVQKQWQPSCPVNMCLFMHTSSCVFATVISDDKQIFYTGLTLQEKNGNYDPVTSMFLA